MFALPISPDVDNKSRPPFNNYNGKKSLVRWNWKLNGIHNEKTEILGRGYLEAGLGLQGGEVHVNPMTLEDGGDGGDDRDPRV
jgi:hypothetical protein